MGGNALKNTFTRRYQAEEYHVLSKIVLGKLKAAFYLDSGHPILRRADVIAAYRTKESFGDMDILYYTDDDCPLDVDTVGDIFAPNEIIRNSGVISFDHKELQIDLIHIDKKEYDYGLNYFKFSDCGNLCGKIAHKFGLKHGHRGLYLPLRDGNNKFGEILLTRDHDKTLEFLGLSVESFNTGFETLDDVFKFVSASPHYSPEFYKLENLNCIAKVRDKKRDTYRKFLEYGETWTGHIGQVHADKNMYLKEIFDFFPGSFDKFKKAMSEIALQQVVRTRFNGELVSGWTGLAGKELGGFMKEIKGDYHLSPHLIVYSSECQLRDRVMQLHNDYVRSRDGV